MWGREKVPTRAGNLASDRIEVRDVWENENACESYPPRVNLRRSIGMSRGLEMSIYFLSGIGGSAKPKTRCRVDFHAEVTQVAA